MGNVARLAVILLAICLAAISMAQMIGSAMTTRIATAYLEDRAVTYALYVRDVSRNFRVWLAGSRCFRQLPPWANTDHDEIINMALDRGLAVSHVDHEGATAIARLEC